MCQLFHPTAYLSITLKEFISDNKLNVALILGWIIYLIEFYFTNHFHKSKQKQNY